jgi:hypothetical protein
MQFVTAAEIINDAAVELGLQTADVADPYASTNPNIILLRRLLKSGGQELRDSRPWSWLIQTATITTANGTSSYALPDDFGEMIDQTGWNRSTIWPLGGPLTAQEWQSIQANTALGVFTSFRFLLNQVYISPTPTSVQTITYEYRSTYWVSDPPDAPSAQDVESSAAGNGAAGIWLPRLLMVRKLKLDFTAAKGFDTTNAQRQFDDTYAKEAAKDSPGRVLSLNSSGPRARLIDGLNVPDTGYGS